MVYRINDEILTSAQRSAGDGTTNYRNYSSKEWVTLVLYITAKSGSPTLTLDVQCSPIDPGIDATKWRTFYHLALTNAQIGASFPKIFASTRMADWSGWVRVIYTVAGATTPKLTFSLNLEAK